jgi:acyl CoA:acetate/3-ketoacid CoA transferase
MPEGLTVTEIAPGIDLKRDVLAQSETPLLVSSDLREMDQRIFRPEPMNLELKKRRTGERREIPLM